MDDLISRAAAIEYLMTNMGWHDEDGYEVEDADVKRKIITDLVDGIPAVDAAPVVRCRDCLFFVVKDHWAEWNGIPILAASDCPTCTKWGGADGCMTKPDGYCFMGEPKEAENGTDHNS